MFSGIGGFDLAAEWMGWENVFHCEWNKFGQQVLKYYWPKAISYEDITKTDFTIHRGRIDILTGGFPCQPFSIAGDKKGLKDKRGNVFFSCIDVIVNKKPKYFILENVKGIISNNNGKTWNVIEKELNKLKKYGYNIYVDVLNTKDYGIPHNRERLFIVGCKNKTFEWPTKVKMNKLENYIDWDDDIKDDLNRTIHNKIKKNNIFIDLNFLKYTDYPDADKWSPCLNTQNGLWNVKLHRFANSNEKLKLQGFTKKFNIVVSKTQFNKQIGNTISVNVLKKIIKNLLSN